MLSQSLMSAMDVRTYLGVVSSMVDYTSKPLGSLVTTFALVLSVSSLQATCPDKYAVAIHDSRGELINDGDDNLQATLGPCDNNGVKFNRGDNGAYTRVVWDMGEVIPSGTTIHVRLRLVHCSNTSDHKAQLKFWRAPAGTPPSGTYFFEGYYETTNSNYHTTTFTLDEAAQFIKISDEQGCAFRVDCIKWQDCSNECGTFDDLRLWNLDANTPLASILSHR